jgi:hypothetical protein
MTLLEIVATAASSAEQAPRSLMIALDAVPYHVVEELTDPIQGEDAHFQSFQAPVPFISTFPSSTSVAMGGILGPMGLEKSPGYEARFFDWEQRRARGGGLFSYFKVEFPWRSYFDWGRKGPVGSSFEAVRPIKSGTKRLRKAIADFVASDKEVFLIYVAATDTAAHILNPEALKRLLIDLDTMLIDARSDSPDRPFEVVMISDHGIAGGDPLVNTFKPIKKALKKAHFRPSKKLAKVNDVVLTPFGLVSSFEAYVEDDIIDQVSRVLVETEGVDVCGYRVDDHFWVENREGGAFIVRQGSGEDLQWSYEPADGDPLKLQSLLTPLPVRDQDGHGWVGDRELFEASLDSEYPDPFYRLQSAFELVINPASIVCSLEPGYMFGSPRTAMMAKIGKGKLRWTHGALSRQASLGFLMSDSSDWKPPPAARFDEGLVPFVDAFSRREPVSSGERK